jgi:hypothetical protein
MLGKLAWQTFSYAYGFSALAFMVGIAAIRDRVFTKSRIVSKEEEDELEKCR